jgi:hypothetical protein
MSFFRARPLAARGISASSSGGPASCGGRPLVPPTARGGEVTHASRREAVLLLPAITALLTRAPPLAHAAAVGAPTPARPSAAPQIPAAGLTVAQARTEFDRDRAVLDGLAAALRELASCIAVEAPPDCAPSGSGGGRDGGGAWASLRARAAAGALAAARMRSTAAVVGAAAAEAPPPGARRGSGWLAGALDARFGRQISPADLDYYSEVEQAAYELDDDLLAAAAKLESAAASTDALIIGAGGAAEALAAVARSTARLLAFGGGK